MVPIGDWAQTRLQKLSKKDHKRDESQTNSGFGKKVANWVGREKVYPTNVLHMATECSFKNHGATFPIDLPSWFIKLFTKKVDDVVLDPFSGSGTAPVAAKILGRHFIGIDINQDFCDIARERLFMESRKNGK